MTIYVYMWEFQVKDGCIEQFESMYGPEGDWVQLFKKGDGYLRTELHHDINNPNRYITIDYWKSKEANDIFRKNFESEFTELDKRCELLTENERLIGSFTSVESEPS